MNILKKNLLKVRSLCFISESNTKSGWSGSGSGEVEVKETENIIIFTENGSWKNEHDKSFNFNNVYRWTFIEDYVKLEHLRFGDNKPVFLFNLVQEDESNWSSQCPHKCDLDFYSAGLSIEKEQIVLNWTVQGKERDETINYWYKHNPEADLI